jgi:hypothetical protein
MSRILVGATTPRRPVNALEAEGRRNARFWAMATRLDAHPRPGRPPIPPNPHYPFTLDLRWHAVDCTRS